MVLLLILIAKMLLTVILYWVLSRCSSNWTLLRF